MDFWGLETVIAGSLLGTLLEGIGEAWGWARCAAKSLWTVFSVAVLSVYVF